MQELCQRLGPGWSFVTHEHDPGSRYWFKLTAASRWPLRLERTVLLPNGAAMSVAIETPDKPMRLLVVDGKSDPLITRTAMLGAVAEHCRRSAALGEPIGVLAGDFNTLGRSVGFDAIRAEGFALAANCSRQWRGTYPTWLPLYDIDHVWAGRALRVAECDIFRTSGTNHRGQIVTLTYE